MRLIIREYLNLIKESGELDRLLPDLLLSMSIPPISTPQIGVRQAGVDVAAVGKDRQTKKRTLFLFLIKQGDLGRADWHTGVQGVRASLDEVEDSYLKNNIAPAHADLPVKIIVCTGGELKQDLQQEWAGYIKDHEKKAKREYDFWGGAELSQLIEQYLLSESVLPAEFRSKFRKTLALLSDPDYDFGDYFAIVQALTVSADYGDAAKRSAQGKILKALRTINLCQNIIFYWALSEDNIRPAIICSERTVLGAWELIRRYELFENEKSIRAFVDLYRSLIRIYNQYAAKVQGHCFVKDGFAGYGHDYVLDCLSIFENLGFLATAGLLFLSQGILHENETLLKASKAAADMLKGFITNQKASHCPCYDGHIIEISEAIFFLHCFKEDKFIEDWIRRIVGSVCFSYLHMDRYFPIASDSFDDLVALNCGRGVDKKKLFDLSTLLPILAQWCVTLGFKDCYELIRNRAKEVFESCTMQIWYPDEATEEFLYKQNAARKSGNSESPLELDISFEEMRERMTLVQEKTIGFGDLSCIRAGLAFLAILSSRHFRTPFLPFFGKPGWPANKRGSPPSNWRDWSQVLS